MKQQHSMVEALRRNKAQGFDITISIGPPGGGELGIDPNAAGEGLLDVEPEGMEGDPTDTEAAEKERRELDLAPNATELGDEPEEVVDPEGEPLDQTAGTNPDRELVETELAGLNLGKGGLRPGKKAGMKPKVF